MLTLKAALQHWVHDGAVQPIIARFLSTPALSLGRCTQDAWIRMGRLSAFVKVSS